MSVSTINKTYAVKRGKSEWWVVVDCGPVRHGGMTTGSFHRGYFNHEGRTYRYMNPLFEPPADLKEWTEIQVKSINVTMIADQAGVKFEGWEDEDDSLYKLLSRFSHLIEKPMTPKEVKELLDKQIS